MDVKIMVIREEPATHALLFMAIGIRKKWKQPLAFFFSGNCVTADRLAALIKEVLGESLKAGLKVVATVCDNYGVNIKALNSLGSSTDKPYIEFDSHKIFTIMDPPHLLKCFRNNFMKYDIECTQDIQIKGKLVKGIAKWHHIKTFYDIDNTNPNFVFAPALTKQHLEPNFKQKMKVSLASQVLSHSVAAGIFAKVACKELPQEAVVTAMVIEKMDKLFDSLNGDTPDLKRGKKYLTNMSKNSPHLPFFKDMKRFFEEIKFIGARRKPPSQDGFIRTLNAIELLYHSLQEEYGVQNISTRRLNQDPLENCFGCIRSNCGCNHNPNTVQFVAALKASIVGNLINISKHKNCLDDENNLLSNLKLFLSQKQSPKSAETVTQSFNFTLNIDETLSSTSQSSGELQACAYVCGFIIKKLVLDCSLCKIAMLANPNTEVNHIFTSFRENMNTYVPVYIM